MNPATGTGTATQAAADEQVSALVRWTRRGYVLFAGLFVVGVVGQVFIAGMAVFVDPANWSLHATFVHAIELLTIVMLVLSFPGRLSRWLKLAPVVLFLLIGIQYATALGFSDSVVAALHPVNALVIFGTGVVTTQVAWREATAARRIP